MIDELKIFHELIAVMNMAKSIEELPQRLLAKITVLFDVEAGSIFLLDEESRMVQATAAFGNRSEKMKKMTFQPGYGICGKVIATGRSFFTNDAYSEPDFNREVDNYTGFVTRNIICSPIVLGGKVIGAIEILNRKGSGFTDEERQLLELVSKYLAYPIENAVLEEKLHETRSRAEAVVENLPGGMLIVDTEDMILSYNRKAAQILNLAQYSVRLRSYREAFKTLPDLVSCIETHIKSKQFAFRKELQLIISGKMLHIGYSFFVMRRKDDRIIGFGFTFQDITGFKK